MKQYNFYTIKGEEKKLTNDEIMGILELINLAIMSRKNYSLSYIELLDLKNKLNNLLTCKK